MKVRDVMTHDVITALPDAPVHELARLMVAHGVTGLPIVAAGGRLVGVVTELDLIARNARLEAPTFFRILDGWIPLESPGHYQERLRHMLGTQARDVMTATVVTIGPQEDLETLAELMIRQRVNPVPVVEQGQLVGIVSRADIVRMMSHQTKASAA